METDWDATKLERLIKLRDSLEFARKDIDSILLADTMACRRENMTYHKWDEHLENILNEVRAELKNHK